MAKYSTGSLVAGAIIRTAVTNEEGNSAIKETAVKKGDAVTITYAISPYGDTETRVGTVIGFQGRTKDVVRGATRIYDGVPTYKVDPDGGAYWTTLEEIIDIRTIIISGENGAQVCHIDDIVDIDAGEEGD